MTVYEVMTMTIESFTQSAILMKDEKVYSPRAMIIAAIAQRDNLTIEAASCEVY